MQQHLVSESHPSFHIQAATLRLCIIFFESVKCGHPGSVLSYISLFFQSAMRGEGILITLTATNANNQSTQLASSPSLVTGWFVLRPADSSCFVCRQDKIRNAGNVFPHQRLPVIY